MHRQVRFKTASLLLITTLFSLWMGIKTFRANKVRQLERQIDTFGGKVISEHQLPAGRFDKSAEHDVPEIILEAVGKEWFDNPKVVILEGIPLEDSDLRFLREYPDIQLLQLAGTNITDIGLNHVAEISGLQMLYVYQTKITDEGIKSLRKLNYLVTLDIRNTYVTDKSFEILKNLASLKYLYLSGTKTTEAGLRKFLEARPNCQVTY